MIPHAQEYDTFLDRNACFLHAADLKLTPTVTKRASYPLLFKQAHTCSIRLRLENAQKFSEFHSRRLEQVIHNMISSRNESRINIRKNTKYISGVFLRVHPKYIFCHIPERTSGTFLLRAASPLSLWEVVTYIPCPAL